MPLLAQIIQGLTLAGMGALIVRGARIPWAPPSRTNDVAHWLTALGLIVLGCSLSGGAYAGTWRLTEVFIWSEVLVIGGLLFAWGMFRAARAYVPYRVLNDWRLVMPILLPLVMMAVLGLGLGLREVPVVAGWITLGIIGLSWVLNLAMMIVKRAPAKAAILHESK
jgi:hypothetical protein